MTTNPLSTFDACLARIGAADSCDGWLSACEDSGRYLVPCRELAGALARLLAALDPAADRAAPVLEVCAGGGELAEALRDLGVPVVATDADPPAGVEVFALSAAEALARYRPAVVLGAFVPIDSGVDEAVMSVASVRHYVTLGARLGGLLGSASLWRNAAWKPSALDEVSRWLLTRHDVWLGERERPVLRHGEAWHFARQFEAAPSSSQEDSASRYSIRGVLR